VSSKNICFPSDCFKTLLVVRLICTRPTVQFNWWWPCYGILFKYEIQGSNLPRVKQTPKPQEPHHIYLAPHLLTLNVVCSYHPLIDNPLLILIISIFGRTTASCSLFQHNSGLQLICFKQLIATLGSFILIPNYLGFQPNQRCHNIQKVPLR